MSVETPRTAPHTLRSYLLPLLGYLGLAAVFYAPILLGLRWFPQGDFTDHFLPFSLFQRSEVLAGRLPVWNPYTFSGHPFLADVQAAVFYPISNLVLALSLPWGEIMQRLYWLQVEVILQIALGGFFTYLLVCDLARSSTAAFLAGSVFAFSGYLTGYPPLQTAVLRTAIWLPLVLWCLARAFEDRLRWRWWIAAAFAYAIAFLGGHPQTFLLLTYCMAGWLALLVLTTPGAKLPWIPKIAVFFALFLGLSAAQLAPSVEFTALSVRANVDYTYVSGGFSIRDTWQMLVPRVVSQFSPLYVGLIALGLALLGAGTAVTSLVRRRDASAQRAAYTVLFFAVVAVLALLASYGRNGFLYPLLYRLAPGWSMFRGQERAAYLVAFALSVLAGFGFAAFARLDRRARIVVALGWAAVAGLGLLAFNLVLGPSLDEAAQLALRRGALTGVIALLGLVLAASLRLDRDGSGRVLTLLVLVELFAGNVVVNLAGRPVLPSVEALEVAAAAKASGAGIVHRVQNQGRLPDDYGMLVGVEDVSGSSPLRLARYDALLHDFPLVRLWQLTGVKTVLSPGDDLYVPSDRLAEFAAGTAPGYLHRLAADYPRAWVVRSVYTAGDEATLPLLGAERVDLSQTALLPPVIHGSGRPLGLEDGLLAGPGNDDVRVERVSPAHLRIHANTETGGYLVVSENWMPGWEATVVNRGSRQSVPVLRTDLTLVGLPLMPGESEIELRYRPASVWFGLLLSVVTLLSLMGASMLSQRRVSARGMVASLASSSILSRLGPLLIVLVGFGLRVFRLGNQELRGDESLGRLFSMQSVPELIRTTLALREPHPVASYAIQGGWLRAAGHSEFALRFVSAWFGALAVAIFYRLVRQLGLPKKTALIAAGLLAVSPYAIWHSQDARMYSINLALTLASTLLMLRLLDSRLLDSRLLDSRLLGSRSWLAWGGYVIVTWLALQTHYYAAYIVVAQNLFVFLRAIVNREERRSLPRWVTAELATGLLYLPWLIAAAQTLTGYSGNGDSPSFVALWLRSMSVFAVGESVPASLRAVIAGLAAALAIVGAIRLVLSGSVGRRAGLLAGLMLLVPLLTTWVGALRRPIFNERYIIAGLPGFLLLISASFGPLPAALLSRTAGQDRWLARTAALLASALVGLMAFSLFLFYNDPAYSKSIGWRQLAAVMERHTAGWPARDVRAAQSFPDPTLWYYYDTGVETVVIPPAARDQVRADDLVRQLAARGVERIVIAVQGSAGWDDNEIAPRAVQAAYRLLLEVPVANWRLQVYGRPLASLDPVNVSFSNGLRLEAARVTPDRLIPGDVLPVHLRWRGGEGALTGNEKLTLQVLDAQGKLAAQVDQPFGPGDLAGDTVLYGLLLPRTLEPGAYRLIVALYDPSKDGAPRVLTQDGADRVELKTFVSP